MNHLILGLGGTGARVWQALHRRLSSRLEPASGSFRTAVDAVILDTDARNLRDDAPGWSVLGAPCALPAAQRVLLEADTAALTALLHSRADLRATVCAEEAGWEERLARLGAIDGPLSVVGARLPGWPTRRLGRLLLALHQGRVRVALDAVAQSLQARHGHPGLVIHVVAHLGGATGAGLLLDLLALLQRHPPVPRCSVHVYLELPDHDTAAGRAAPLAEVQAYAALRELQAAAQEGRFGLCFLGAMTDERGLQPLEAEGRERRLADWLFHAVTGDAGWMPAAPRAAAGAVRPGEFAAWGLAERGADRDAVRAHLAHELMLRLLAQLRYNHWRPGLGYVTHPRPAPSESLADLMAAWGLSDAHLQLAVPLAEIDGERPAAAPIEQEWQTLESHYLGLVELVAPVRRIGELRRLFEQGLAERFRGQGVEAAFDLPDHAVRRRAVVVRQRVESALWDDWRAGRRSLHECGQLLASVLADVADRFDPLRQEQRTLETQAAQLVQQVEAREQEHLARFGPMGWLRGGRERDLSDVAGMLREQAVARTRSALVTLSLRLLAEVQSQLTILQGMVDAGELAVAALAEETDAAAARALPPRLEADAGSRIDTREQLAHWRTQLVTRESMQREHLRVLRAALFEQVGEAAGFRVFAQRMDEAATCDALLAACGRRFGPTVIQPVVESAWDAWMMRLHAEPDRMARELAALRAQAAVGLAWTAHEPGRAAAAECARLPRRPQPADVGAQDGQAGAAEADEGAGQVLADGVEEAPAAAAAVVQARPAMALPGLADVLQSGARTPLTVQEWPAHHGSMVLMRVVRGLGLHALPRVQELHLRHEAHRLQSGRAALWMQLDAEADLPELLAADVQAQKARARTVVLLAEALGLLREEADPATGATVLMHVRVDADGFELDRVRLGRDPAEAVELARERLLHDLFDQVRLELVARAGQGVAAQNALRDAMLRRIELLRSATAFDERDQVSRAWNEAARVAMKLVRQELPS